MLRRTTAYLKKSAPGSSCLSHRRDRGGTSAVARSCGWVALRIGQAGRNGNRVPWFFTITPLFGTIASWGFGVNIHHFERRGGREALDQNGTTKQGSPPKVGAFFVYSDQRSSSLFRTFLSYEELSFSFFFFFFFFLIFCQNQTCCLSRVCCTCDSWGRGNWRTKRCQLC